MENIIPSWEWRTFGESFGEGDARYAALTPCDVQETDELYLLSSANDQNVKVRFDLMDIKTLPEVNADGLEQWKPVMKAKFPPGCRGEGGPRSARNAYSVTVVARNNKPPDWPRSLNPRHT